MDPVSLLAALHRFAKPSEIAVPAELLRAGAFFQARGLINTQAIQYNPDRIWPYWVVHQFNPQDKAFIPRAFQLTHVNLTNRNWTAVGLPYGNELPIIDPRGLITPFWDGWSVDLWYFTDDGAHVFPSRLEEVEQTLSRAGNLSVITEARGGIEISGLFNETGRRR